MSAPPRLPNDHSIVVTPDRAQRPSGLADPVGLSPKMRIRRAATLLLMTLLAPGSAQLVAGNKRIGRIALKTWLGLLAALVLLGILGLVRRSWLLGLFTQQWLLVLLALVLGVVAIGWFYLFFDAMRLARLGLVPPKPKAALAGLTAVLMLLTSGSLVWGASNVLAGRSALASFSVGSVSKEPAKGRFNLLLLGGDSGASRVGTRPDTIMLASIDADTGKTVLFGFSRETENINFREGSTMKRLMPEGWNCGDQCLLNGIYTWAMEHKDQFPADVADPGALATREAVEALSGLDIQYYALVDLKGFRNLIDAVGGLTIDVKKRTPIGGGTSRISGYIEPGVQRLDGYHALWYARSRAGSSNYERMERQRCVLTAMSHQINPQTVIFKFKDIAEASGSVLKTDMPSGDFGAFADLALQARSQKMKSVNFVPPLIKPWSYDPSVITTTVAQTIERSEADTTAPARKASATAPAKSSSASTPSAAPSAKPEADDTAEVCSVG